MLKSKKISLIIFALFVNMTLAGRVQAEVGFGYYATQNTLVSPATGQILGEMINQADFSFTVADWSQTKTVSAFNDKISLTMPAEFLAAADSLSLKEYNQTAELPWSLDKLSGVYEYAFNLSSERPLTITLKYEADNNDFKQIYFFDEAKLTWQALPTTDYPQEKTVKAAIKLNRARIALFAKPGVLTVGKASWYKYQGGLFAASPDFPKGSKLRVTNLDNNKSVEVVINDWGPERDKHPDRVIDLDKEAFTALAPTSAGVINVMVSPIEIAADRNGRVLGVKAAAVGGRPTLSAEEMIIIHEASEDVILSKNSDRAVPLASLTKLVAAKVFLGTKPDLDKVVSYSAKDEALNYNYCKKGESAKLSLKDGEKLKVKDLLYASLVGSTNNTVETLVRISGLSRADFIAEMNNQAKDWGAKDTKFIEPTGLSTANVSTAKDYALIMKAALSNATVADASVQPTYSFKGSSGKTYKLANTNRLLAEQAQANLKAEKLPISGSKTGYLAEAGYCLATRVKAGLDNFIIVTLGAKTREQSFNEMTDLIKYLSRLI